MRYTVIIEEGQNSFGAYVPDLPGCVAVSKSRVEVIQLIQEAIEFHVEGKRESKSNQGKQGNGDVGRREAN